MIDDRWMMHDGCPGLRGSFPLEYSLLFLATSMEDHLLGDSTNPQVSVGVGEPSLIFFGRILAINYWGLTIH